MRPMPDERLEKIRALALELEMGGSGVGTGNGVFAVRFRNNALRIIASDATAWREEGMGGEPWEHVSVSLANRCPNWDEMCFVKDLFWLPEEAVMQLHPPKSRWVNNHPYCLHLWKPCALEIPLPPDICVGVKAAGTIKSEAEARELREAVQRSLTA